MTLGQLAQEMETAYQGQLLSIPVLPAGPDALTRLLETLEPVTCSAEVFLANARKISGTEAERLLAATLHRDLAYFSEIALPLHEAKRLAKAFIHEFGPDGQFYSTSFVPEDEVNGIGGAWYTVTTWTFESVLYCVGGAHEAFVLATGED